MPFSNTHRYANILKHVPLRKVMTLCSSDMNLILQPTSIINTCLKESTFGVVGTAAVLTVFSRLSPDSIDPTVAASSRRKRVCCGAAELAIPLFCISQLMQCLVEDRYIDNRKRQLLYPDLSTLQGDTQEIEIN